MTLRHGKLKEMTHGVTGFRNMLDARTRLRRRVVGIGREDGTWSSVHNDTSNIADAPMIASRLPVDRIPLPADPTASRSAIFVITARRTAE